jgi:hypothetical protein
MILAIFVLGTSACASPSRDPFEAKIKAGHFTKRERDYATRITELVYGPSASKLMASYYNPVATNLVVQKRCFDSLQPRIFYSDKPGQFGRGYSGNYSFEPGSFVNDSRSCNTIERLRFDINSIPSGEFGTRSTSGTWIRRKVYGYQVLFQIKEKNDDEISKNLRLLNQYKRGYFSKSEKCAIFLKPNRFGTSHAVINYYVDQKAIKHIRLPEDEKFDQYRALASSQYTELTDSLSKDAAFVECYMRGHLVALGMEGGAFLPRNYVKRQKPDGTAGYCDLAKLLPNDRNDEGTISCRVPTEMTAGMVLIYARLQVSFPGEPRVVSRAEFTYEVLKYLSQVKDDYTDK